MGCIGDFLKANKDLNRRHYEDRYKDLDRNKKRYLRLVEQGKRSGRDLIKKEDSWLTAFIGGTDWDFYAVDEIEDWKMQKQSRGVFDDLDMARAKKEELDRQGLGAFIVYEDRSKTYRVIMNDPSNEPINDHMHGEARKGTLERLKEC
jgi:hypothetical protein